MASVREERKLATILFADLVGSTADAHGQDPERVRVRLDRFYQAMAHEIERTGGTVEKFAGDSVMAAFGVPLALEDHAERALHAALAMQRRLEELFDGEIAVRIGVNTGEVVVGRAREGSSFVTGDSVNVGSRLEQAAAPGEVLAGERTVAAAGGAFEFGDPRIVDAKGKPEGVVCRPVLRALSLMRPRGVGGLRRVFVGRESELELLRATYRRAAEHAEPHLVTIVGEPGVGKTRLVGELWETLAHEELVPVRRTGRCPPYGDGITYWPLGELLKEHLGIQDDDHPEDALAKLADREILGLALGLDVARELHPLDARERLHEAAVLFVEEIAADLPAVLLFEDVHWAEGDLLDLLERIANDARAPVLMLATARPELLDQRPGWGARSRNATTMWLQRLPVEQASRLLEELLPAVLPDELRERVVEKADGNPFFIEELVGALVDAGVLERANGRWALGAPYAGFALPDTVHAVLAARLDRLPSLEKAALQAGAVVGRVFWTAPVVHLLSGEEPDFDLLEERDLIRASRGSTIAGQREYVIKHALTREVAYSSIPKARRGRLHAALAAWLERSELANDEHASLLAYHYSEAVKPEDTDLVWGAEVAELERLRSSAVHWLRRAGELARGRYEMLEAVELFTKAVELSDDEHERALLWRDVGLAHALRFDGDAFWSAMQSSLDGPLAPDERADVYGQLAFQTSNRSGMWDVRAVPELVREWSEQALERAGPDAKAHAHALIALVNIDPAAQASQEVALTSISDTSSDIELRSYALQVRASIAFEAGHFFDAAALVERRLELVSEVEDPDHLLDIYESASPVLTMLGRLDEARRLAVLHESVAAPLSAHHRVHSVALRCEIEDAAGGWEEIAARSRSIVEAVENNLETPCTRNARSLTIAAFAHTATEGLTRAEALQQRARDLSDEGWSAPALASPLLRLALARGDLDMVRRLLKSEVFRMWVYGPGVMTARLDAMVALRDWDLIESTAPAWARPGLLLEPFALRALGAARGNDELLARAEKRFHEFGLDWHAAQTERLLAGL